MIQADLELLQAVANTNHRLFATLPASQFAARYSGMAPSLPDA